MKKGKLIVIDGADGCGKATQVKLLQEKLNSLGKPAEKMDFPQYYNNFFGHIIGKAQKNDFGEFVKVPAKIACLLYACDRFESKPKIEAWLTEGKTVVLDRYVSANQLHQAGKIRDETERTEFLTFLEHLEHGVFDLPRPDLVVYLDVPHEISLKLMSKKDAGEKKAYSDGGIDKVEQDAEYQLNARESGLKMLQDKTWVRINCTNGLGALRSIEGIHGEIFGIVKNFL